MIGHIYRLMDIKRIERIQREIIFSDNDVIVKPDYLSICAADQRYYFGRRSREILDSKLPMALIHEATATVMYDKSNTVPRGSKAVLLPLTENASSYNIKPNYNPANSFASSGTDGFMQDIISIPRDRILPIKQKYSAVYVFAEILSVAINAIDAFEKARKTKADCFGIWGDGSVGYVMGLALRLYYPDAKIYVFGKTLRKLQHFSFADKTYTIDRIPSGLVPDHCFECVGGENSEAAMQQIIDMVSPQGCINLLGVCETPVAIRTRAILDKGLILIGNSRSSKVDFEKAMGLIDDNRMCRSYLNMLISQLIEVRGETDIISAFEQSSLNDFKTVMKWEV